MAVLGVVTDPDLPTRIGSGMSDELSAWLGERTGDSWRVDVVSDPVTAGETDPARVLSWTARHREERGWTYAICVTDLPLLPGDRPVLAEVDVQDKVAFVSLPVLGGWAPHRRMRRMLTQLLDELLGSDVPENRMSGVPIVRATPERGADVRYTTSRGRGWVRLLTGMVRANSPWRLIFGLSSALAAALATSAFGLSSTTIWQIGDLLDPVRRVLAAFGSVALLVFWLIASHHLWERKNDERTGSSRLPTLYNASTVLTLSAGVACMYAGLFVINLGVAAFLVPSSLLTSTLGHPADATTYVTLAWGFTTMGMIAGAMGSSLESDRSVRQAAYGYREQRRRAEYQRRTDADQQ